MIRALTHEEIFSPEFWHLLWLACESDEEALRRVRDGLLSELAVIGAVECEAEGRAMVIGFAAYQLAESRVTIEYIATSKGARGTGLGTQLVRELQRLHPGVLIFAQTDDDAIGFYRSLGFVASPAPRDARWPERPRYDCVLHPPRIHRLLDLGKDWS